MPPTKPAPATELPEQTLLRIGSAVRSALYRWMYDLTTQVERDVIDDLRFAPLAAELREARNRRGLDLKAVAKTLKAPQYVVQRLEGGSLADLRPGLLERYAAAFGLERRLERWQRANPELASRLVRPTGQPPMLAVIEQQMIGEILRNANLAPAAPASTAARRAVGRDGRVLQLKIVLEDIDPPIWRRVVVGADATLHGLHEIIQTTMGWHDSHLYRFDVNDAAYSDLALWDDPPADARDARRTRVVDLELSAGASFQYEYDFGDGWLHRLEVEQVHEVEDGAGRPSCLGGARACPPEDCGGPGGYQELLGILADPSHPEHDERREWVGEDFDPESFDVASVNARLARSRPRRRR